MDREQIIAECRQKCSCQAKCRRRSQEDDELCEDQRSFCSFVTETISVMAFIFFGSVVFWLAVGGILFDFIKRLYYSDRYVKIFIAGLFTLLILSMAMRVFLHKRACKAREQLEQEKKTAKVIITESPKPPPEYMKVAFKDKRLAAATERRDMQKTFTLTITDERRKEVFKTSKYFFIPEMAMDMRKPPALIIYLKEIVLEDY